MKVILTGGTGFIGSCFLWKLNSLGIDHVIVVDTKKDDGQNPNIQAKKFKDYLSKDQLLDRLDKSQLKETEAIVHLGACSDTTERNKEFLNQNNLEYSKKLAEWCLAQKKVFHYASSAAIYGDGKKGYSDNPADHHLYKPLNLYGDSKWEFDDWVIKNKVLERVVGYRYFNVFGPNEYHKGHMRSMVCKAFQQYKKEGKVSLFATTRPGYPDGSEERDFVYIKDVLEVMAFFLQHPDKGGIYNLGTGKARSFKDLVLAVFKALEKPPRIEYVPMPENLRGQYQYHTQADISALQTAGFQREFMTLEQSIQEFIQGYLSKPNPYL